MIKGTNINFNIGDAWLTGVYSPREARSSGQSDKIIGDDSAEEPGTLPRYSSRNRAKHHVFPRYLTAAYFDF